MKENILEHVVNYNKNEINESMAHCSKVVAEIR